MTSASTATAATQTETIFFTLSDILTELRRHAPQDNTDTYSTESRTAFSDEQVSKLQRYLRGLQELYLRSLQKIDRLKRECAELQLESLVLSGRVP